MYSIYKIIERTAFKWSRLKTILWYKPCFQKMGKYCLLRKPIFLTPNSIIFGDNVYIGFHARIEGILQYQSEKFHPQIVLNDGVSIQQNLHLTCAESVEIGKNTAIAANVSITDIHHPYDDVNLSIEFQNIISKPVYIGEDCKIYNNSVILQGTKIGKHCTIGANSVVSGEFPDYCIIVGAPAKIIKRYSFEKQKWLKTDSEGNFTER